MNTNPGKFSNNSVTNNRTNNNTRHNRYNNKYNNNKFTNNKYTNRNHGSHHQTQAQPLKIAKEQILELNNYVNDVIEVYIGKNLKLKGKLLSYDLENLDMILDESVLYLLKDLTLLTEEEEMELFKSRENTDAFLDDIYDDKIDYGLTMVKGNMIISFNKAM